jgi:hypothetical protein
VGGKQNPFLRSESWASPCYGARRESNAAHTAGRPVPSTLSTRHHAVTDGRSETDQRVQRELVLVARLQHDLRTYTRQTVSNHKSNESRPHAPKSGARLFMSINIFISVTPILPES